MKKYIFFLLMFAGFLSGCNDDCGLTQSYNYIKLIDKTTHEPLIKDGKYKNDTVMVKQLMPSDSSIWVLPQTHPFFTKNREAFTVDFCLQCLTTYFITFPDGDIDTIQFACGSKKVFKVPCFECEGYYNQQLLCTPCEDDKILEIEK